ncbi:hypothetical protein BCO18442_00980 [Burkholderia contaminans]|nr:hypothetical protein BCO18442_00980 [Burkholderia contaminans]
MPALRNGYGGLYSARSSGVPARGRRHAHDHAAGARHAPRRSGRRARGSVARRGDRAVSRAGKRVRHAACRGHEHGCAGRAAAASSRAACARGRTDEPALGRFPARENARRARDRAGEQLSHDLRGQRSRRRRAPRARLLRVRSGACGGARRWRAGWGGCSPDGDVPGSGCPISAAPGNAPGHACVPGCGEFMPFPSCVAPAGSMRPTGRVPHRWLCRSAQDLRGR